MYSFVLALHSWVRWLAVIAGILACVMAFSGRTSQHAARTESWGRFFIIALDIQLLLGLLLYFVLSPNTKAMFDDFGAAMRDPNARFWAVEHGTLMLVAVVLAHVGKVLARKVSAPESKQTRLGIAFLLATIAMLAATPWPGMANGRPLFRLSF
jgi:glucose uptake protein GlcU